MRCSLFPSGLTSLSPMDIPSHSHLAFTSLLPCPKRHGPAFNGVCSLFIWRMAPCESITLLLSGPLVPFLYRLRPYVAFFLWLSGLYMASFMATTPAVTSLRLRLPCNLGIHYLLALTAHCVCCFWAFPALLRELGVFPSLFGSSEQAPERRLRLQSVATRRASLPCTVDVSRPRTRDTTRETKQHYLNIVM